MKSFGNALVFFAMILPCTFAKALTTLQHHIPCYSMIPSPEMFELEETSSIFFNNKLMSSPTFGNQDIYMTTFSAKGQEVIEADMKTTIEAEISILYAGTKKNDFAISISDLVNNKEAGTLLESLMVNGHFGPSSSSSSVKFENVDSVLISTTTDNTVLFMSLIAV
eukprot:scaffold561_cov127-Chaetoceros_neogracile.AAC.1